MMEMDPEFARMMTALADILRVQLTALQVRGYWKKLRDIPRDDLKRIFDRALEKKWYPFPQPGELLDLYRPNEEDASLLAWSTLNDAVSRVGAYTSLDIDDPAAAYAVELVYGSWPAFCEAPEHAPGKRSEFLAAYRQALRRNVSREPARLAGLLESSGTYAPPGIRRHSWVGVIAGGRVESRRDSDREELNGPSLPEAAQPARR